MHAAGRRAPAAYALEVELDGAVELKASDRGHAFGSVEVEEAGLALRNRVIGDVALPGDLDRAVVQVEVDRPRLDREAAPLDGGVARDHALEARVDDDVCPALRLDTQAVELDRAVGDVNVEASVGEELLCLVAFRRR